MSALQAERVSPGAASSDSHRVRIAFDNSYARLPGHFYARSLPAPVAAPRLLQLNVELAGQLGLDPEALASPQGVALLAGNLTADGSEPLALAYAGHQFGHFVPQLGDGRALLLGEVVARDGRRYDLQLKGAGRTAFSRGGDGRAALGPVLREYLVSEAMAAMGIPSTRALAAVLTGETVLREMPLPGAVFTRVASSHLRVGTFQYFAARGDLGAVRTLADYAIDRHYPELKTNAQPYSAFLEAVLTRHAHLVARWMAVGFIHGVMNTDNTSISGETLDYGPCAFMEAYDPGTVFSSIDHGGRYAFDNQPNIALWNMARLAETLLPLLEGEHGSAEGALGAAHRTLAGFQPLFEAAHLAALRQKLGLGGEQPADATLAAGFLNLMAASQADFTLSFRHLAEAVDPAAENGLRSLLAGAPGLDAWLVAWRKRMAADELPAATRAANLRRANPLYIPRNHQVEAVIQAAMRQDFAPFQQLLAVTAHPFEERPGLETYAQPARPEERVLQTFCGT